MYNRRKVRRCGLHRQAERCIRQACFGLRDPGLLTRNPRHKSQLSFDRYQHRYQLTRHPIPSISLSGVTCPSPDPSPDHDFPEGTPPSDSRYLAACIGRRRGRVREIVVNNEVSAVVSVSVDEAGRWRSTCTVDGSFKLARMCCSYVFKLGMVSSVDFQLHSIFVTEVTHFHLPRTQLLESLGCLGRQASCCPVTQ